MSCKLQDEVSIREKHEQWISKFGKVYKDETEKEKRFQIFKDNMEFIESFNAAGNKSYKLGVNHLADLTDEEFNAYSNGNVTAIPAALDWRAKGAVTPVKCQETKAMCMNVLQQQMQQDQTGGVHGNREQVMESGLEPENSRTFAVGAIERPGRHVLVNRTSNKDFRSQGPYGRNAGCRAQRYGRTKSQGRFGSNNRNQNQNNNGNDGHQEGNSNNGGSREHYKQNSNGGSPVNSLSNNIGSGGNREGRHERRGRGEERPLCNRCNKKHYGPNCPWENPNCFNCNQPGHFSKNCWEPKRGVGSDRPAEIWKGIRNGQE